MSRCYFNMFKARGAGLASQALRPVRWDKPQGRIRALRYITFVLNALVLNLSKRIKRQCPLGALATTYTAMSSPPACLEIALTRVTISMTDRAPNGVDRTQNPSQPAAYLC